jgi:hypothetical protein
MRWLAQKNNQSLKGIFRNSDLLLLAAVFFISIIAAAPVILVTLIYAAEYGLLDVPIASWFVFGLVGVILVVNGLAFSLWLRFHQAQKALAEAKQDLAALSRPPLTTNEIPVVCGYQHLDQAEFLVIIQTLFKYPPSVQYVHLKPLPGGYSGSTTLLADLQYKQSDALLPRSFVIKLGLRREILNEYDKFHRYVLGHLGRAARFFRHARWGEVAGIAYEFVGLGLGDEIQSFYHLYQEYPMDKAAELMEEIYTPLEQTWYRHGRIEAVNPYHEYHMLNRKKELILNRVDRLLDENDPYRQNLTTIESKIQPDLKPNFCPASNLPWYDPVAFLRTWPGSELSLPFHYSIVHGDLNARNILIERGRKSSQTLLWFIDFSHTGNGLSNERTAEAIRENVPLQPDRGHTLRDFCRLEADVKFILTRLETDRDLELALTFEQELLAWPNLALTPPVFSETRFQRAWQFIRAIRRRAAIYLADPQDMRPYYWSLLHATLPIVYYHSDQFAGAESERQQKRYAFISAGMLCRWL